MRLFGTDAEVLQCRVQTVLPEGWTTDCRKSFYVVRDCDLYTIKEQNISGEKQRELSFIIIENDNIQLQNKVYLLLTEECFTVPFVIPTYLKMLYCFFMYLWYKKAVYIFASLWLLSRFLVTNSL